jgi:hypothetical protein
MRLVENSALRAIILSRMDDLRIKPSKLLKDAGERGMKITPSTFSKWKKGLKGGLTDTQVLFIACMLYIPISINFGLPEYSAGKIKYVVPKFDQLEALKLITKIFGKNG